MFLSVEIVFSAFWGFLVGFIGWGSCLHLPEPISEWLLHTENPKEISVGIARLLIMIFLIFAIFAMLSWVPMLMSITQFEGDPVEADLWRNMIGVSFVSSLIGFFTLGFLRQSK